MRLRWRYLLLGILGICGALIAAALQSVNWGRPRITQGQVKREIKRCLPLGSTIEQTVAFLGKHGWVDPHEYALYANRGVSSSDGFEANDPTGQTLTAGIPDAYPGFLISGGIFMKFGFNARGRLTRYDIRDVYTGL